MKTPHFGPVLKHRVVFFKHQGQMTGFNPKEIRLCLNCFDCCIGWYRPSVCVGATDTKLLLAPTHVALYSEELMCRSVEYDCTLVASDRLFNKTTSNKFATGLHELLSLWDKNA